ncbi:MAG: SDR family oxidoreductase [Holosporales bacterium]|jgi:dTDP-4-dehydrorhamnose reductase
MTDKILITGSTGVVGQCLTSIFRINSVNYTAPTRNDLDIKKLTSIPAYLDQVKPNIVVHLAAETNVDLCEIQRQHAILVNYEATKLIADYCKKFKARMIYVSTSGVLSGNNRYQHSELDIKNPGNFYALTKMRGEDYIESNLENYLIIRAAWMIGIGQNGSKKFAEKIYEQIASSVPQVKAVNNLYGSLTSGKRLAQFIFDTISTPSRDLVHCASNTVCSRYDIAKHIRAHTKSPTSILPVSACEFPLSAPRGFSEGLTSEIAHYKFNYTAFSWEEELDFFLGDL